MNKRNKHGQNMQFCAIFLALGHVHQLWYAETFTNFCQCLNKLWTGVLRLSIYDMCQWIGVVIFCPTKRRPQVKGKQVSVRHFIPDSCSPAGFLIADRTGILGSNYTHGGTLFPTGKIRWHPRQLNWAARVSYQDPHSSTGVISEQWGYVVYGLLEETVKER